MKGKFVLIPFPFTDLAIAKLRPALVIHEEKKDVIVAFISSRIPSEISITDVVITAEHHAFKRTGLKVDSVIKLDKVATVLKDLIVGELGEVDETLRKEINEKLRKIFTI
ncbi:MAG: type II toxin-antitoxin system PemK/MazF family toxin [Candidatus Thermoplasmatota archaeon]|nr:type II toxin-antitoxin system PemK/MazF family toxin [Candidatus Thermoplasmatota archaeon]